jgi:hypothetical protein
MSHFAAAYRMSKEEAVYRLFADSGEFHQIHLPPRRPGSDDGLTAGRRICGVAGLRGRSGKMERWLDARTPPVPWRCHRSLVADALEVRGVPVIEVLSESNWRPHPLTPFAQVEGTQITYPPQQASLL